MRAFMGYGCYLQMYASTSVCSMTNNMTWNHKNTPILSNIANECHYLINSADRMENLGRYCYNVYFILHKTMSNGLTHQFCQKEKYFSSK